MSAVQENQGDTSSPVGRSAGGYENSGRTTASTELLHAGTLDVRMVEVGFADARGEFHAMRRGNPGMAQLLFVPGIRIRIGRGNAARVEHFC